MGYAPEDIPQNTLGVNDGEATECDTHFLDKYTVISGDLHVAVRGKRQLKIRTETTLLTELVAHAKWKYSESVDTARTSVSSSLNWAGASLKARISVGQTKVEPLESTGEYDFSTAK